MLLFGLGFGAGVVVGIGIITMLTVSRSGDGV